LIAKEDEDHMIYALGPRALHVYQVLHTRLCELDPGTQLPTIAKLVEEFGVAPLTIRQVLAKLEEEGYVSREQGRGTFVRERVMPTILVVDDDLPERMLLAAYVTRFGHRVVDAAGPEAGLAALERDPSIALLLSDVRMPQPEQGIAFIKAVRRRKPQLPLAAVTGFPDDLAPLHGTADCPVLIIPKPVWAPYIEEVLRLTIYDHSGRSSAPH
jgi:CheY-like chemotaxis protein